MLQEATQKEKLNLLALATPTVIVAALGYFVDIYDLILFSIVRIKSLSDIGIAKADLTEKGLFILNAQMIGMLVGGILWGVLGDKKGRLRVLYGSILLYSLANIANGFVTDVPMYALVRFIAGVGLAGELGAGITLVAETAPKSMRGVATSMVVGFGVVGAVLAYFIAENFDWRTCYFIGGGWAWRCFFCECTLPNPSISTMQRPHPISGASFLYCFSGRHFSKNTSFASWSGCQCGM